MPSTMDRATARVIPDEAPEPGRLPDGLSIRYLDGSTTATPLAAALVQARRDDLRVLDREAIPTGPPAVRALDGARSDRGTAPRPRPADVLPRDAPRRRPRPEPSPTAAPSSTARSSRTPAARRMPRRSPGSSAPTTSSSSAASRRSSRRLLAYAAFTIRTIPDSEPLPRRLRRLISLGISGRREHREIEQLRCERGAAIARKAGFDDAGRRGHPRPPRALGRGGDPRGLKGAEIHPLARILAACQGLDVFLTTQGRERAVAVMAERVGTWYDPDIADALLDACDARSARRPRRPGPRRSDDGARARRRDPDLATTPTSTGSRSPSPTSSTPRARSPARTRQRVADIAEGLAARMGLPAPEVVDVRRAGLLHDLGKLGVPNTVLDKPGRLDAPRWRSSGAIPS